MNIWFVVIFVFLGGLGGYVTALLLEDRRRALIRRAEEKVREEHGG